MIELDMNYVLAAGVAALLIIVGLSVALYMARTAVNVLKRKVKAQAAEIAELVAAQTPGKLTYTVAYGEPETSVVKVPKPRKPAVKKPRNVKPANS